LYVKQQQLSLLQASPAATRPPSRYQSHEEVFSPQQRPLKVLDFNDAIADEPALRTEDPEELAEQAQLEAVLAMVRACVFPGHRGGGGGSQGW
jgi:hypothetical protein